MEKIKITFLGTGDSVPTKTRNHTALLLSYKAENILIDCGEGTQRQFKKAEINPCKLTRILISHWHGDHFLGLPGLLQTLAMLNCSKKIKIYGPRGTRHFISLLKQLVRIEIPLEVHELSNKIFIDTPEFYMETKSMHHLTPANAYSFVIKDKIRLDKKKLEKYSLPNSKLLKDLQQGKSITWKNKTIKPSQVSYMEKGRKISFVLDTAPNKNAIDLAKNSNLLIIESQFVQKEKAKAEKFKHLTLPQAISIAKKAKVKRLILTHVSQRYEKSLHEIESEAKKLFKNASLARDLGSIEI